MATFSGEESRAARYRLLASRSAMPTEDSRMARRLSLALSTLLALACSSPTSPSDAGPAGDTGPRADTGPAVDTGVPPTDTGVPPTDTGGGGGGDTGAGLITPDMPGPSDVQFAIDSTMNVAPISPYIYGLNAPDWSANSGTTITRFGGNRITAYNWENNASNAGSDYMYENDDYLCASSDPACAHPGEVVRRMVSDAQAHEAASLVALPMAGYVSADTAPGGDVRGSGSGYLTSRFRRVQFAKGAPFALTPDTSDGVVYDDEFVNFLETTFPSSRATPSHAIFYELDNEPDLWSSTHAEIHPMAATYAEMATQSAALAAAIKGVAPDALVFGFVSYGYAGYVNLQSAPDAMGRDFIDFFLDSMHAAETSAGHRLVDALDLHWYPEATGAGTRIIEDSANPAIIAARLQAPRSLWDPSYVEESWITSCCSGGAIRLIPRLRDQIAAHYPGTHLAFSEYNYGGATQISGGIAEADVLGIFGREGVFMASEWPMAGSEPFIIGGMRMYRNYDGAGGHFGDTTIGATNSDIVRASVYASVDTGHPERMVVVAINKTDAPLDAGIAITHTQLYTTAHVYTLTAASATPAHGADVAITARNAFVYTMPAMSVTTLVLE
jgi:hypothetical protein